MRIKKSIQIRTGFLLLIPVFIYYINHSLDTFHSHIYSEGIVITHSHPLNDCEQQVPERQKGYTGDQIIVIHGFWLVLDNEAILDFQNEFKPADFKKIILPVLQTEHCEYINVKSGRAPPANQG